MSTGACSPGALPPLREVIARYGLDARRSLGQHFLLDSNLTRRIARAAGIAAGDHLIEVGPGPGGLTRALLDTAAADLVAVERDRRCLAALAPLAAHHAGRLRLIDGDALDHKPASLCPAPRQIVSNLPYNVGTALLLRWLDRPTDLRAMTLMFQTEVANRLTASPGNRSYGRLSVFVQWLCEATKLFDIPARAFTPAPRVSSSLVRLVPRPAPAYPGSRAALERVTGLAFAGRRKMLRRSLAPLGNPLDLIAAAAVPATARAEALSPADFCRLAVALTARDGA